MQPQGAALAAGKVLRGLRDKEYVASHYESKLSRYEITNQGRIALAEQSGLNRTEKIINYEETSFQPGATDCLISFRR